VFKSWFSLQGKLVLTNHGPAIFVEAGKQTLGRIKEAEHIGQKTILIHAVQRWHKLNIKLIKASLLHLLSYSRIKLVSSLDLK